MHASTFLGLDGRPTKPSIAVPRFGSGPRNRAFVTLVLCHESVTVAARRTATRQKNPGGPPARASIPSIPSIGRFGGVCGHSDRFLSHSGTLGAF